MVRLAGVLAGLPKRHQLIAQHIDLERRGGEFSLLDHFVTAVVAQAAHIATLLGYDRVEQAELCIAAIHHIQAIGLDRAFCLRALIVLAATVGSDIYTRRHMAIDFEMCVYHRWCDRKSRVHGLRRLSRQRHLDGATLQPLGRRWSRERC